MNRKCYHALILAGGFGTRLWPKSRQRRAKQFLCIHSQETLLEQTVSRIRPMFPWKRIWVVTKPTQKEDVLAHVPGLISSNVFIEPCPKGTAAAISWATARIESLHTNSVIAVLPSDHLIEDEEEFRRVLDAGLSFAGFNPCLVTFGIKPSRAEPAYGYIEIGRLKTKVRDKDCYDVMAFHEKPDRETALNYLSLGSFFWNSGIFAFSSAVLFEALKKWMPAAREPLEHIRSLSGSKEEASVVSRYYNLMPDGSLDKGLLEKASNVVVFPCNYGWHDMGVWETYYDLSAKDEDGNAVDGLVASVGCKNCLLMSEGGILLAAVGTENMVIVAEGDAVLVCPRNRLGEIQQAVEKIRKEGLVEYL
ncbi:MAG: NTP transferase domain-containing protein [Deltaproteobacteria bacterium]|nr:NTP transferase domain-containing protein [Deltaproteobacteria bacterium]MDL1960855.1 NTP transferase domain-containing protein [Deltaproteobacteria bacterium]